MHSARDIGSSQCCDGAKEQQTNKQTKTEGFMDNTLKGELETFTA